MTHYLFIELCYEYNMVWVFGGHDSGVATRGVGGQSIYQSEISKEMFG